MEAAVGCGLDTGDLSIVTSGDGKVFFGLFLSSIRRSCLTNTPCFALQSKYFLPCTVPSFLPEVESNMNISVLYIQVEC